SFTIPITTGGKNPPSPPAAPTIPVAAPVDCGKSSGTALKTAPLPRPRNPASVRQAIVTGSQVGLAEMCASQAASSPAPTNTKTSTVAEPIRSERRPPTGRASVAEAGVRQRDVEPVAQQLREEHRHRHEAAEGDEVEEREPPQLPPRAQHGAVVDRRPPRRILGHAVEDER